MMELGRGAPPIIGSPLWLVATGGTEHIVRDSPGEWYWATACGARFVAAPLATAPGRRCSDCLRAVTPERRAPARRRPFRSLRRLLRGRRRVG